MDQKLISGAAAGQVTSDRVTVVTVTYGQRASILQRTLAACMEQGVGRVVVVDNASSGGAVVPVQPESSVQIERVRLECNLGSAGGYASGIERALAVGAEYIWLLDDDNVPEVDCLEELLAAWRIATLSTPADRVFVAGFRWQRAGRGSGYLADPDRRGSFIHFHVRDIPRKLASLLGRRKPADSHSAPADHIDVPEAPYGGVLFHRAAVQRVGGPRRDLVLYMDDIEFTRRLQSSGGKGVIATRARITDAEFVQPAHWGNFGALRTQDRWRSYYAHRNKAWLDHHPLPYKGASPVVYYGNMVVWLSVLFVVALGTNRLPEFALLTRSIRDGLSGRLGLNPSFPLP
jgi:GT2 family glycosyltransferase